MINIQSPLEPISKGKALLQNTDARVAELLAGRNASLLYNQLLETIDQTHSSNVCVDFLGMSDQKYFLKNWSLPSLSLNQSNLTRRRDGFHDSFLWKFPGDEITVSDVTLKLFCDENLILFEKINDLFLRQSQRLIEYFMLGSVHFFNNMHDTVLFSYILKDCYISNIGPLSGEYSDPTSLDFDITLTVNSISYIRNPFGA